MGTKRPPGLYKRGNTWHIDKQVKGYGRLCESTGCNNLSDACQALEDRIHQIRKAVVGVDPIIIWREAATKYLVENQDKASILNDALHLKGLDSYIGDFSLQDIHDDTLRPYVSDRRKAGIRTNSINRALALIRRILNLAARSWRRASGRPWLSSAPLITMQKPPQGKSDARKPYNLDWDEQDRLLRKLNTGLARMALYGVNTGCRESEICGLRWEWEWHTDIEELKGRVFVIPGNVQLVPSTSRVRGVKNREDRLVVLNDIAKSVVDDCRGDHPERVFVTDKGAPYGRLHTSGWKLAWIRAGLPDDGTYNKGVHNLRHTFATRLRACGVSNETRKTLMGHKNGDITTHYSAAGIFELLEAVNKLCNVSRKTPALTLVKVGAGSLQKRKCL